jgi:hypothetical protein
MKHDRNPATFLNKLEDVAFWTLVTLAIVGVFLVIMYWND